MAHYVFILCILNKSVRRHDVSKMRGSSDAVRYPFCIYYPRSSSTEDGFHGTDVTINFLFELYICVCATTHSDLSLISRLFEQISCSMFWVKMPAIMARTDVVDYRAVRMWGECEINVKTSIISSKTLHLRLA